MTKTKPQLRECPFCGGEAKVFYTEETGLWDVQCQGCGALPFVDKKKETVAEQWNRRAADDR